jgi:hypothetical protein
VSARTRSDRHLQSLALRRGVDGASQPRVPRGAAVAPRAEARRSMGRAVRIDRRSRAPLGAQRLRDPQVLPERLARRTAQALPRSHRRSGRQLEVQRRRLGREREVGQVHGRVSSGVACHEQAVGAVVRDSGRQQVVHAFRSRRCRSRIRCLRRQTKPRCRRSAPSSRVSDRRPRSRRLASCRLHHCASASRAR